MRRIALATAALLALVFVPASAASAEPSPAASIPVPAATPGQAVCTVDATLSSMVGLAATANGYAVAVGANTVGVPLRVYLLDTACKRKGSLAFPTQARDPQDIQVSADGATFWVGDIGDDLQHPNRPTIALWKLPADGARGTLYHFAYPDGAHDAEAMLMNGDGTPIFVTHTLSGPAGIYVPTGPLDANRTVALKKVGDFTPQKTGTDNKLGVQGNTTVTGGADAPDGKRVALRTLSDAYEWDVPDGDVLKAITTTTPRITPLPNEPMGDAIAYSHDGKNFLTVSNFTDASRADILKYVPAAAVNPTKAAAAGAATGAKADTRGWLAKLTLQQLTYMVAAVGVIGLIMVFAGVFGIRRARNRPRPVTAKGGRGGPDPDLADDAWAPAPNPEPVASGMYQSERYDAERYPSDPYGDPDHPPARAGYGGGRPEPSPAGGRAYGTARPTGYEPPDFDPPDYDAPRYGPVDYDPPGAPRRERGVARPRRPEPRGSRGGGGGAPPRGWSEHHDGFGDLRG